jgi:nucleoside-diphosphate-sugar epimerase
MRVFVTGASGAIGTRLVPQLIEHGHEVIGIHKSPGSAERLRALGATALRLDLLDRDAVIDAVVAHKPDAIIHERPRSRPRSTSSTSTAAFHETNLRRTQGTDALLAAAEAAGVTRFVAQSYASARYVRTGGMVKTEDDPLDPTPPSASSESVAAMIHLEDAVTTAGASCCVTASSMAPPTTG